ncbi:MAG: Gfo/Idh/MocA family protein [Kiritimatiellia bacterium]|jgi:predicted dehydrogenase
MKTRLGVIGAGYISRFHFKAYQKMGADVRIVADTNAAAARAAAAPFNAATVNDWQDVVNSPDVDAVTILVPSALHAPIARAALEAGKHVVSEKTLALSAGDSLALARLAEERNLLLFTSYMKRFFPAVQKAKSLMPRLGHVTSVYCRTYQGVSGANLHTGATIGAPWGRGADGVSSIMKLSGGGILVCGGSHIFDLLLFLVGKPQRVYARQFHRPESDVDIMTHALFDFEDGGIGHFEGNWHPLNRVGCQRDGWDEGFEISGVGGRLVLKTPVWNEPERHPPLLRFHDAADGSWTDYSTDIVCPFEMAERHFQGQIAKGEQGDFDRYVGYRVDQLLETTQQSATQGQPLDIPWADCK